MVSRLRRSTWLFTLGICLSGSVARAQLSDPWLQHTSPVPPFVPRAASVGLFLGDAISWQARLTWEVNLVQQSISAFDLIFEGGGGYGIRPPQSVLGSTVAMTFLSQYSLQAGAAYRARYRSGFRWGFQATVGALIYGARYDSYPTESNTVPSVEGYAVAGWELGKVTYGVRVGVAQILSQSVRSAAQPYLGGFSLGFQAEWR